MKEPASNPFERGKARIVYRRWWMRWIFYIIDAVLLIIMIPIKRLRYLKIPHDNRKILIAKLDHLGDFLIAGPTLNALRRRFKDAEIYLLTSSSSAELLTCMDIDFTRIIPLRAGWVRHNKGLNIDLRQISRLIRWMRSEKFDLFIDLRGDVVTILTAFIAGVPEKVGFNWGGLGPLLERSFRMLPDKHMSEVLFQVARYFQDGIEFIPPDFVKDERNIKIANEFLSKTSIEAESPLIGMQIGAGVPARRWSTEKFAQLAGLLVKQLNATIIVLGDASERQLMGAFHQDYGGKLIDAVGKFSLPVVLEIIGKLHVLIANNSFLGHVAALKGTPVISIFSSSNDPIRWRPFGSEVEVVRAEVSCWGCGLEVCPLPESCLDKISVSNVYEAIIKTLEINSRSAYA